LTDTLNGYQNINANTNVDAEFDAMMVEVDFGGLSAAWTVDSPVEVSTSEGVLVSA